MKFFHLRVGSDGVYHRTNETKVKLNAKGGMTIGYEPTNKEGTKLMMTFARCSEKDVFNRKRAIAICKGRMEKGKFITVDRDVKTDKYEILLQAAIKHEKAIEEIRKARAIK